jgi:hypothetical protein
MKILLLAPEPFYQDRGTPIAVRFVLTVLSERGDDVDVVTYHEGQEVTLPNVTVYRILNVSFIRNIRPGFSWKKIVCDCCLMVTAANLARRKHYDVVHAVEESVFIALALKWMFKIPYIYDRDSSLTEQMIDRYRFLSRFQRVLTWFENVAIRNAKAAAVVCEALVGGNGKQPEKVVLLPDITLLD